MCVLVTLSCSNPLPKEFSIQEFWSGLPFPSPGDLPHPGIEPGSPALQADSLPTEPPGNPLGLGVRDKVRFRARELFNLTEALLFSKMECARGKQYDCLLVVEGDPQVTVA